MASAVNITRLPANARRISIPAAALGPWLAEIDDATELRVTLRALALLADGVGRGGAPSSATLHDLTEDKFLNESVGSGRVAAGLAAALGRGTLVAAKERGEIRVFLNDAAGRSYLERKSLAAVAPPQLLDEPAETPPAQGSYPTRQGDGRANIFALYEKHIGSYGHSIAEQLKAAEAEYPLQWIKDAFEVATEKNAAASWNYVQAVLHRWSKEGRYSEPAARGARQLDRHHEHGEPGHDSAPDSRTGYLDSYRRRYGRLPWESGEPDAG